MTSAQRKNAILNSLRAAKEFFDLLMRGKLDSALSMEKEAIEDGGGYSIPELVAEWTKVWTTKLEKPSNASVKAKDRSDTAVIVLTGEVPVERQQQVTPKTIAFPGRATATASLPVARRRKGGLIEQGRDQGLASDFVARHGSVKAVKEAAFFEQRAAVHKGNGDGRRARTALDEAIARWQQAGVKLRSNWPFARALYLCQTIGSPACEYQVLRRLVKEHPEGPEPAARPDPDLQAARARMAELERTHPRAFLLTPATGESRRTMVKTAVAAGGILATTALVLGALGKLIFGGDEGVAGR